MEPSRNTHATLVDLLDRILDKGLVINADVIISVAGIPLIGVNLRAALAGMETMLKYGVMQAWDEKSRIWEREHRQRREVSLLNGEEISLKIFGSYYYSKGIYAAWRSGYFYITNKRLILWNRDFDEIIFQIPLERIKAVAMKQEEHFTKDKKEVLYLINQDNGVSRLHAVKTNQLKEAIEERIKSTGLSLEEHPAIPEFEEAPVNFLKEREKITHRSKKIWYLVPEEGIQQETWRPGHLYLTNKRLCWWNDFDKKLIFNLSVEHVIKVYTEMKKTSGLSSNKEKVLDIIFQVDSGKRVASFSGKQIDEWEKVLVQLLSEKEETEACPQCGKKANVLELLEEGCANCEWVSPKLKKKLAQAAK